MNSDQRKAIAELLRRHATAQQVLRTLRWPMTVPELASLTRRPEPSIREACRLLRLAGCVRRLDRYHRLGDRGRARLYQRILS